MVNTTTKPTNKYINSSTFIDIFLIIFVTYVYILINIFYLRLFWNAAVTQI